MEDMNSSGRKYAKFEDSQDIQTVHVRREQDEQAFKAQYSASTLKRHNTLALKTSYHTINIILMALCQVMESNGGASDEIEEVHSINLKEFLKKHREKCLYEEAAEGLEVVEHQP